MNFLFRGGPQTVEREREGGREEEKGVRIPTLAVCANQLQGALRDSIAEHGVQFCHRLREVTQNNLWKSASETAG